MDDHKVIQIMPLDEYPQRVNSWTARFTAPNVDRTGNTEWIVVGAALTDDGCILPVVWDGRFHFKTVDYVRDAGDHGENSADYWDGLTSGEYPRTAEAVKKLNEVTEHE